MSLALVVTMPHTAFPAANKVSTYKFRYFFYKYTVSAAVVSFTPSILMQFCARWFSNPETALQDNSYYCLHHINYEVHAVSECKMYLVIVLGYSVNICFE